MRFPKRNLERLKWYMVERETIRILKEKGQPPPWTADPILGQYKFTNVHRYDDYTTKVFWKVYSEHWNCGPEEILYNCGLYRYFGQATWPKYVGWLKKHDERKILRAHDRAVNSGESPFTGAYIITNAGRCGPKVYAVMGFLAGLWHARKNIVLAIDATMTWEAGYHELKKVDGFGGSGFMAKEVLQDFLMAGGGTVQDHATWTPMGPGGRRGMNRLLGRDWLYRQAEEKFIAEVKALREELEPWWHEKMGGSLTAHDVQFNLCEYHKYERTRLGEGRPRSFYRPRDYVAVNVVRSTSASTARSSRKP